MASSGILAQQYISTTNQDVLVYTCPANESCAFTIIITNQTTSTIHIWVSISPNSSPFSASYVEYNVPIYPNENYIRTGLLISNNQNVFVKTDTSNVSVNIMGITQ